MRVLVCGTRTFTDQGFLFDAMDAIHADTPIHTIIEGEAKGADTLAKLWAESRDVWVEPYPADWDKHGKAAGPIRNKQMLTEGKPDVVVAFLDKPIQESKGTKDMLTQARKAGVENLTVVWTGQ